MAGLEHEELVACCGLSDWALRPPPMRVSPGKLTLPARGWKTAHTQAIVDALVKADAEEEDEEAADTVQVYVGYQTFDGGITVERIQYRSTEGTVLVTIPVNEVFTTAMFKRISKSAMPRLRA